MLEKITPRTEDFSRWYTDVIAAGQLADYAPVKGCMVIRPNGFALWENFQRALDGMFKETGHENAYFPLFIPESFLKKEAEHVEGFAPECAVVTHGGGKELEEPLVVRPTSETIIWAMFRKWIESYRDLPLLMNQWCNVVRWEMRTRLFLRTLEFLWQEGHTAHGTAEEAEEETRRMLEVYRRFAEDWMAMPVISGIKTEREKFAGAVRTYSIEAMMQDRKALQSGTSHNLGQNFARAFDVTFQNERGEREFVWATSWGVSTRLIGALIMTHGDDKGIILPPKLAPTHCVLIPIYKGEDQRALVLERLEAIGNTLSPDFKVKVDKREGYTPGWKFYDWEQKGVPLRVEMGPRDLAKNQVVLVRRDTGEKIPVGTEGLVDRVRDVLDAIQRSLFEKARSLMLQNSVTLDDYLDVVRFLEGPGGFVYGRLCNSFSCEEKIQEETKATVRCIPFDRPPDPGPCLVCGKTVDGRVVIAKGY
ncbi:MAG: proline--tRNA ligase [Candidatus Tectomicrobia bacterium]|uniref:Proline--tRNA ligase n=1 Tax=Tectimicrobiota bacterium TaxID=2528274 RepID=A0A932GMG9_UNCTE|nr:proline--tRNA ligase [Candidatus Tectomicrobia bacterium]